MGINDPRYTPMTDTITNGTVCMDIPHYKIHEGTHFFCILDLAIPSGTAENLVFRCIGKPAHIVYDIATTASIRVRFSEDPTVNVWGGAVTISNRNRGKTFITTQSLAYSANTVGAFGTGFSLYYIPATNQVSTVMRGDHEWILEPGHDYAWELDNTSGAQADGYLYVSFYEAE